MNNEQKEQMIKTNAFDGVSFDPEKRLERFISDIEIEDNKIEELCQQYGVDSQKLKDKHFRLALDYLYAQSRCLSWAITGPARFPVKTQEKRQATCEDRLNRLVNFENNIEKYLKKITRQAETQDDKKTKWLKQIEELKARQEMMKDVNKLIRQGKKDEAEKSITSRLKRTGLEIMALKVSNCAIIWQTLKDWKTKSRPLTLVAKNQTAILNLLVVKLNMTLRKFAIISFLTKSQQKKSAQN